MNYYIGTVGIGTINERYEPIAKVTYITNNSAKNVTLPAPLGQKVTQTLPLPLSFKVT